MLTENGANTKRLVDWMINMYGCIYLDNKKVHMNTRFPVEASNGYDIF